MKTRKARRKQRVKNTFKVQGKPRRVLTNGLRTDSTSPVALGKAKGVWKPHLTGLFIHNLPTPKTLGLSRPRNRDLSPVGNGKYYKLSQGKYGMVDTGSLKTWEFRDRCLRPTSDAPSWS